MYMISPITNYVGAPFGIVITVITAGGFSYAIGAFGERAVKALYDLSYKGILR